MGLQQVLWMLALTVSSCMKVPVKISGRPTTNWMFDSDALPYREDMIDTPRFREPLSIHDGQENASHNSTSESVNQIICYSENIFTGSATAMKRAVSTVPTPKGRQKRIFTVQELRKAREVWMLSEHEASLGQMLAAVVKAELRDCDLVVAYDTGYSEHAVLHHLLLLHNTRQVVYVNTTEDLTRIIWTSSKCRGYFFLLDDPEPLLTFATTYQDTWDYGGRYVLVVPSLHYLQEFIATGVGERTEHVVGTVKVLLQLHSGRDRMDSSEARCCLMRLCSPLTADSVTASPKSGNEGEWVLYMNQLYWGPGVRRINTWYRHRFTHQLDLFPDKLSDLQGAVLKVTMFHLEPYNFLVKAENGSLLFRYGMEFDLVKAVARALNITLEFTETPNGETFGEQYENGTWYGLMGQLHRREVDIGLANLFISNYWLKVIDMTAPYTSQMTCFLARVDPPLPRWQSLAFPFHQWTWLAVLVGIIVSGPLLFLLARGSGRCGGEIRKLQDLGFAWYYAFGIHFSEAHTSLPRSTSTQIFVLFLWLYTMVMTMSYSASLKAFLMVKKQPAMMETIEELYKSGIEVAALAHLFRNELALSSIPYLQGLTRVYKYYDTQENIFRPLLQGKTVYLENINSADYLINNKFSRRGVSRVRIMKERYATYNVAMGLQRHSPLKRKLDQVMGWVEQSGLVRKFFLDALRLDASLKKADGGVDDTGSGQEEDVAGADGVIPLSLDHMQGLFLITCFGWLSSVLSYLIEKLTLYD